MSPLPLLLSLALGGALVLALVLAIRRGIREQAELDELSDLVEYEEADEPFSGPIVTQGPSQQKAAPSLRSQNTPIEASAFRPADSLSLSSRGDRS